LLGEIFHALPIVGAFSGKMERGLPLSKMALFSPDTAKGSGSRTSRHFRFLTAGT
jgi:hypothetical protein